MIMQYKTNTKYGPIITELHPLLVQPLVEYLGEGRPALLRAAQRSTPIAVATAASLATHRYVFVSRSGRLLCLQLDLNWCRVCG
jgi:hypothetical protein